MNSIREKEHRIWWNTLSTQEARILVEKYIPFPDWEGTDEQIKAIWEKETQNDWERFEKECDKMEEQLWNEPTGVPPTVESLEEMTSWIEKDKIVGDHLNEFLKVQHNDCPLYGISPKLLRALMNYSLTKFSQERMQPVIDGYKELLELTKSYHSQLIPTDSNEIIAKSENLLKNL